ncbi:MAG: hypothetical protein O3A00_00905 [Planctomycetota bacterium]|nr:hypothetical protein [Planctomycetota bacterium]
MTRNSGGCNVLSGVRPDEFNPAGRVHLSNFPSPFGEARIIDLSVPLEDNKD